MNNFNEVNSGPVKNSESVVLVKTLMNVNFFDKEHHLLLKACEEQQAFFDLNGRLQRRLVGNINRRLNKLKSRESGLQLLKVLINQCPGKVFKKHWRFWMMTCTRAAENTQFSTEACDALCMLIETSHRFYLPKKSLSECIEMILTHVLNTSKMYTAPLRCLELLLRYYGNNCKQKLDDIQKFLLRFLDEEDGALIEAAGKCMCHISLLLTTEIKGGQLGKDLQTKLCTTGTLLMDELITNIDGTFNHSSPCHLPVGFHLTAITGNTVLGIYKQANRLKNILKFIEIMSIDDTDNVKTMYADSLVATAQHVLEVNLQRKPCASTEENMALWCVFPNLQVAAFKLLRTFVCCNDSDLQKHGPVFGKLIMQTLKSSSDGSKVTLPFRQLREEVYKFLNSWVLRGKSASYVHLNVEELISQILTDVEKEETGYSKMQKGRCGSSCEMALLSLNTVILTGGSTLSCSLFSKLEEMVISGLLNIQQSSKFKVMPSPYNVTGCRLQLYRLLQALTLSHLSELFFDPQEVSQFFHFGEKDCSPEVAGFCTSALASLSISQNNSTGTQKRKWKKTEIANCKDDAIESDEAGQNPKQIRFARNKLDSSTNVVTCSNGKWKVEKTPVQGEKKTSPENLKCLETPAEGNQNDTAIESCSEGIQPEATLHKSFRCSSCNKQSTSKEYDANLIDEMEDMSRKLTAQDCYPNFKDARFFNKNKVEKEGGRSNLNTVKSGERERDVRVNDEKLRNAGGGRFLDLYQDNNEQKLGRQSSSDNFSRNSMNPLKSDTDIRIQTQKKDTIIQKVKYLDYSSDLDVDVEDYILAYVTPKAKDSSLVNHS